MHFIIIKFHIFFEKRGLICVIIAPRPMVHCHLGFLVSSWVPLVHIKVWHYLTLLTWFLHIRKYGSILVLKLTTYWHLILKSNSIFRRERERGREREREREKREKVIFHWIFPCISYYLVENINNLIEYGDSNN